MRIFSYVIARIRTHGRTGLEVIATLLVIAVCFNLLWKDTRSSLAATRPPRPAAPPPKLPSEPVSLDGAMVQGKKAAKVALIQYSDFECPFCGKFARDTEPTFRKEYVETGRTLYAFRHLPLEAIHRNALNAATVAECADEQGKFWQVHDLLFQPGALDDAAIRDRIKSASLNSAALDKCRASAGTARVKSDAAQAQKLSITGTPTFLIGLVQADGRVKVTERLSGAQPIERLRSSLDRLLSNTGGAGQ
jgi:protein-disulfide isomerase